MNRVSFIDGMLRTDISRKRARQGCAPTAATCARTSCATSDYVITYLVPGTKYSRSTFLEYWEFHCAFLRGTQGFLRLQSHRSTSEEKEVRATSTRVLAQYPYSKIVVRILTPTLSSSGSTLIKARGHEIRAVTEPGQGKT